MKKYFLLFIITLFFYKISIAIPRTWVGASGGTYSISTNWSPAGSPANTDDITFDGFTGTVIVDGPKSPNSFTVKGNSNVLFTGNTSLTAFTFAASNTYLIEVGSTMTCSGTTNTNRCEITMGSLSSSTFNINGTLNLGDVVTYSGTCRLTCANGSVVNVNGSLNYVGSSSSVAGSSGTNFFVNAGGVQEMKRVAGGQFPVGTYATAARNIISGVTNSSYPTFTSSQTTTWGDIEFNAPSNIATGTGGASLFSSDAICENFKVINTGTGNCTGFANGTVTRTLTVNQQLIVNTGTTLNLNSTTSGSPTASSGLSVKGDVAINGLLTETGTALLSRLVLSGITTQNIVITTISNDVSLELNNNAGFNMNSTVTMPFSTNSIVTLTNGIVNLNNNIFEVSNRNAAALIGGSVNAYFYNGFLKRGIDAATNSYSFPLGNGTYYKPVTINFTTAPSVTGSLTANFSTTPPNFPNPSALVEPVGPITNISVASIQGSWFIEKDASLTGGTYTGTFTSNGPTDIIDYTKIVLVKRPSVGGNWTLDGTHITTTGSNTAAVLSRTGMSGFSEFGIGGELGVSLPSTELDFLNASITGFTNTLQWTSLNEINNDKFVVERSLDGRNFTSIGEVTSRAANGNSSTPLSYNFVDVNPVQGKQYYRLQMVDLGGRSAQSQIVTLRRGGGKIEIVDVRPNPTTGTVYFNVLGANANVNIAIRDLSGKEVIRKGLVQSNSFSVDMSKLTNGIYMLEVIDTKTAEKAIFKVVKQ